MDLVYRVRPGPNEELRYSLRSVAANVEHDVVWVVGGPVAGDWLTGVRIVPSEPKGTKYERTRAHLETVCHRDALSEEFVLIDDDVFILRPTRIGIWHDGPMVVAANRRLRDFHARGMLATANLLRSWDIPQPLSYELHVPMPLRRISVLLSLASLEGVPSIGALAFRSLHGNLHHIGGQRMEDVKVKDWRRESQGTFVSTDDGSFKRGLIGRALRECFPEPSPYER